LLTQHKKLEKSELVTEITTDTIPFRLSQSGHIIIDVTVGDNPGSYPFILDSGASNMIFRNEPEFNFDREGWGFGIGSKGDFFISPILKIEKLGINGLIFKNSYANGSDFDFDCMQHIYGIIGIGVMRNLIWQFDFQKKIIVVSNTLEDLLLREESVNIPLSENRFSHHLKATIELKSIKEKMEVLVDLGSNSALSINESELLNPSFTFPSKKINGTGSEGLGDDDSRRSDEKFYLLPSLGFGQSDLELTNVPAFARPAGPNLLGISFFNRYRTTISWKDRLLILEPQDPAPDFGWKTAGFAAQFRKSLNKVVVTAVTEDSPASKENLPLGGEIVAINNIDFTEKGAHCSFDYRNGSDTLAVSIRSNGLIREYYLIKEPVFEVETSTVTTSADASETNIY